MNLTTEQRVALEYAISTIEGNQQDNPMTYPQLLKLLRQLLNQSQPAWQITEERKAALKFAIAMLPGDTARIYQKELIAMLAEAEGKP